MSCLTVRRLKKSEAEKAFCVHSQVWGKQGEDATKVISRETISHHLKHNPCFQFAAFLSEGGAEKLVSAVTTCRFQLNNMDESSLEVLPHEDLPLHYEEYAKAKGKGNAVGCFIISSLDEGRKAKAAREIMKAVLDKARGEGVKHVFAVSTPRGLSKSLGKGEGYVASFREIAEYLKEESDRVIHGFHCALGGKVVKIIPGGRPIGFGGNGALVLVKYDLRKKTGCWNCSR